MNVFVMYFLYLLLLVILVPGDIIFYFFFWHDLQSLVYFYQVVSSLVLDDEIKDLKKSFPYLGGFLFLHAAPCLLGRPGKGIMLIDVAAVIFFYF